MTIFMLILGIVVLGVGVLLLVYPKGIQKFNDYMEKVIFKENDFFSHNVVASILFILIGLWFLYLYFHYPL